MYVRKRVHNHVNWDLLEMWIQLVYVTLFSPRISWCRSMSIVMLLLVTCATPTKHWLNSFRCEHASTIMQNDIFLYGGCSGKNNYYLNDLHALDTSKEASFMLYWTFWHPYSWTVRFLLVSTCFINGFTERGVHNFLALFILKLQLL